MESVGDHNPAGRQEVHGGLGEEGVAVAPVN
eukprot:CAMPEP_0183301866 /NCGR_PEP_ID=MMETSP0160_2-20130417/7849_1 /TAXON_ID=2839 ORGANISM="Odontella Sinensis, Strain Grunow 1884" /NCGR_SAMPLE_ID=MMETSP0160_2 /ASSEMBLY_ACC=CAM_ASM_000250 /LENGTH=30 /DNA_ID= /DNA_START= /DNA_END= /DNA_ORIENTATION=